MESLCPKCGEFFWAENATCRYCGYVGVIPLTAEEAAGYAKIISDNDYAEGRQESEKYFDSLREKYRLKQNEAYDEVLWNNRDKKDKAELNKSIAEINELLEKAHQEDTINLSWKDRNKVFGVTCPTCGSSDHVYRISAAKKGFLAGLMGAASAGLQAKTFQCKNCGYKW